MINTEILVEHMQRAGVTKAMLAEQLKMNPAIINNKINNVGGEVFTVKEANMIAKVLSIPHEMLAEIFFCDSVAKKQQIEVMK